MSEDFLARAERIFAKMKMSSRVVEPELPPVVVERAPVVEGVKDERRYVPQTAAPVGAAPEPTPLPEAARTMEPDVAEPEPQPRRHRIDLLACDEPRLNRKPSGLDFPEEDEGGRRRFGLWEWMTW
jgi:hypothetical protein